MTGKGTGDVAAEVLAERVVNAVRQVATDDGVDREDIHIHTQTGAASSATELVEGVIVDEEPGHENMPRSVEDAAIAVLDNDIDLKESSIDAEYNITEVDQLDQAIEAEENELKGYVDKIEDVGAKATARYVSEAVSERWAGAFAATCSTVGVLEEPRGVGCVDDEQGGAGTARTVVSDV